jgi:hypothetical protein
LNTGHSQDTNELGQVAHEGEGMASYVVTQNNSINVAGMHERELQVPHAQIIEEYNKGDTGDDNHSELDELSEIRIKRSPKKVAPLPALISKNNEVGPG